MDNLGVSPRQNYLLARDDVGRARACVLRLPPSSFTYGKSSNQDHEGVGAVTSSWHFHNHSRALAEREVDFRKVNKYI